MERVEMEREKRSRKSRQMLNLRETICFFFFSLVFHFLASPFLAFLIYRWSLCLSTHLLIRWHEYHILEGFWYWKTFQCSNFKLFESWSNLLSCLRRRFYSIISFDLVMRNLNFRISEFQSCFSKASGIWAILQSRGRSWKNLVLFGLSHHFQLQKNSTRIQGENIVTIWWSRGCLEKIPTSSMYLEALTGQF